MTTQTVYNTNLYLQPFDIRLKDRREVRQINRDTGFPKEPRDWDDIKLKRRLNIEMTLEEEKIYRSYTIRYGQHDSLLTDETLYTLVPLGVRGLVSWDETKHGLEEELSLYENQKVRHWYMQNLIDPSGKVRREERPYPYLELSPNQCRQNAMKVCIASRGEYKYVEGVMYPNGNYSPMTHSWNIDPDGNHVDFTLHESVDGRHTYSTGSGLYFGIEIPIDIVQRVWNLTKRTPPIIPFLDITKTDVSSN